MILFQGDIVLVELNSPLFRLVRFFSRSRGEPKSPITHCAVVSEPGTLHGAIMVNAQMPTVKFTSLCKYAGKRVAIYSKLNISIRKRQRIATVAETYVGRKYGVFKIIAHFLDWCLGGAYFFRRIFNMDKYPICSWVVAYSYHAIGINFGIEPDAAEPDDIWRYVTTHPEEYICIRKLSYL